MDSRFIVFAVGYLALALYVSASCVIWWKRGQRLGSWNEIKAALLRGDPWHVLAALALVAFFAVLVHMRLNAVK